MPDTLPATTRIVLALVASCALGACCGTPKPLLAKLDWSTPEAAVETYRQAFQADEADYEYACLSDALKDRYGIGSTHYRLGRRKFLDANGAIIDRLMTAAVTDIRPVPDSDPPRVIARVQDGQDIAEFELINEPVAWVSFAIDGDEITMELPLENGVHDVLTTSQDGMRLVIDGLPDAPGPIPPVETIHEVRITNRWRLLQIAGLSTSLQQALEKSGIDDKR